MADPDNKEWSKIFRVVGFSGVITVAAFTVTAIMVLRHAQWHPQLLRFNLRVWHTFVTYNAGSTSPGFISSILLSLLVVVIVALYIAYVEGFKAMKDHIFETAALGALALVTTVLVVYGTQFAWEVAKVGYEDHETLVTKVGSLEGEQSHMVDPGSLTMQNLELKRQLETTQAQLAARKQMFVVGDPAFDNIRKILLAFQSYRLYANGRHCFVYITSPSPSPIVTALSELSNSVSSCFTSSSEGKQSREADNAAARGMVEGTVLLHSPKGDAGASRIEEALSGTLPLERSYEPYPEEASHYANENKSDLVIWMQFGPNVRWTSDHSAKGQK